MSVHLQGGPRWADCDVFYMRMYDVRLSPVCITQNTLFFGYRLRSLIADGYLLPISTLLICSQCEIIVFAPITSDLEV